jgi:ribosomal protein L18E
MANTYQLIASSTVGSGGAASINFNSIPATYTDLLLVHSLRESGNSATAQITFNDSTSNYLNRYLRGNGATATSSDQLTSFLETFDNYASSTASVFGSSSVYISNYTSSNNKSVSVDTVTENNATTAYVQISASRWSDSSAITKITITAGAGTFDQHSTAYLYGIKKN